MSCYYCGICKELKDADYQGCNENPYVPGEEICDHCDITIEEPEGWNEQAANR